MFIHVNILFANGGLRGVFPGCSSRRACFRHPRTESSSRMVSPFGFLRVVSPSIWFACYSAIVVVTKWLLVVLGANSPREGIVPLSSLSYLSWWYLNVLLNVWEATGGRWLLDTRLLILFYRILGAKVRIQG